jgi:hypothetical protein
MKAQQFLNQKRFPDSMLEADPTKPHGHTFTPGEDQL